jgi:hypothetical protein
MCQSMGLNCKCKDSSKEIPNLTGIAKGLYTPSPQVFPQGTLFHSETYATTEALSTSLKRPTTLQYVGNSSNWHTHRLYMYVCWSLVLEGTKIIL